MSDKQQSAIDFLEMEIIKFHNWKINPIFDENCFDEIELNKSIKKAKELFKQQIIEAHAVGRIKECSGINTDGYQYFNETFKTESNGNSI